MEGLVKVHGQRKRTKIQMSAVRTYRPNSKARMWSEKTAQNVMVCSQRRSPKTERPMHGQRNWTRSQRSEGDKMGKKLKGPWSEKMVKTQLPVIRENGQKLKGLQSEKLTNS